MNAEPNSPSAAARRTPIVLAWLCLASGFSLATPVPPCPADCECWADGGGLRKASCGGDARWDGVAFPDVRVLALRPSRVDVECHLPQNASLLLPRLRSISLRGCSLAALPSDAFRRFESLQEVDLSRNSLSHVDGSLFAANAKLRYVNLEENPLDVGGPRPLLRSDTVWEVNLAKCNLSGRLPASALAGLPSLRYLSLADNRLETIAENSLPGGLKKLDLSGNGVVNVPLSELHRLKGLKEIDVSRNPVNCTCQLMGFQNWVSSEGTIFRNQIRCALPAQYAGYSLVDVPQRRLCDIDDQRLASDQVRLEDGYPLGEQFGDDFLFDVHIGRLVDEESGHRHSRRSAKQPAKMPETDDGIVPEGSGAEEADSVEGSGAGSMDVDESTTTASSEPRNESAPPSTTPANSTEFGNSSPSTSEVESSSPSTTSSSAADDSSSPPTTVSYNNASQSTNMSEAISPDIGTTTTRKELELTELTDVEQQTTTPSAVVLGGGRSTSQEDEEDGASDSTTTSTSSTEAASSNRVEDPIVSVTLPVNAVSAQVPNSTKDDDDPATTPQSAAENEPESTTTLGQTSVAEEEAEEQREKKSHPLGSGAAGNTAEEGVALAAAPTVGADDSETATLRASENYDGGGNATGQPMLGQMATNETVKAASSTPYIIPSLLIVAVALVCLAIYLSQHNCRPKSWSGGDAATKANGPATELQDVSLLRAEAGRRTSDPYSKKYEAEGRNPQTEKLTNGDGDGGAGDGDYQPEENGASLADHRLPPVKKSTTRVTTNYESLPKTPIIIQKS